MNNLLAIMDSKLKTFTFNTNLTICETCGKGHSTRKAIIQHLANSGCNGTAVCYCRQKVNSDTSVEHMLHCVFFGRIGCTRCPGRLFKSPESANNHAWSAHGGGRYTQELQDTVEFETRAQVRTRFAQMQVVQLQDRARNNTQKRVILKTLVKESDFAAPDSKFSQLVEGFGVNKTVPLFTRTEGRMRDVLIQLAHCQVTVRVNLLDRDFDELWTCLRKTTILKAQGLFSLDIHHHTDDAINNLANQLSGVLAALKIELPLVSRITSLCCKLVAAVNSQFSVGVVAPLVIDALVTTGVDATLANSVWNLIRKHFSVVVDLFRGKLFAQAADMDPIASLTTVVAVLAGTMLMKRVPKESELNDCISGVSKLGTLVRGATFAWQGLEKLISFVLKKIFEWQTGLPAETKFLEQYMEGISQWFIHVQQLVSLRTHDEIARNSGLCARLEMLYRQGLEFSRQAVEARVPREVLQPFNVHWAVLKGLYDKASASGAFRSGPRVEPVVIYLHGTSGVGKSGMMWPLAADLLKVDGIPVDAEGKKDITREIYMRNVEQEFWDNYKNQRVVIYDDFAQIVDSAGKPNPEFMELIRTGNLAPYPLHMATIEEKAKSYFTSRVVICTSNVPVRAIRPESIACREAVRRRFDLVGEVTVKPEYRTRGADNRYYLDPQKVLQITGSYEPCLDVYNIWLRNPLTGDMLRNEPLSYAEFSALAVRKYKERFEKSSTMQDFLRRYADVPLQAQVLTQSEEEKWFDDPATGVRLVTPKEMLQWDNTKMANFMELYTSLAPFMSDEGYEVFHALQMDGAWRAPGAWATRLQKLNKLWRDDASERMRDAAMQDVFFRNSLDEIITGLETHDSPRHSSALLARLQRLSMDWLDNISAFETRVRDAIKAHPYITVGLAVVPLVLLVVSQFVKWNNAEAPAVSVHHEGLPRGERVTHSHRCMWCETLYSHTHEVQEVRQAIEHPHLCGKCNRAGVKAQWESIENEEGFAMKLEGERKFVPVQLLSELSQSGDVHTRKKQLARTEQLVQQRTASAELTASGDVHTRKKPQMVVEIDDAGTDEYEPVATPESIETQMLKDPNAMQVSNKVLHNMYNLEVKRDGEWGARIKVCFIVGRTALTAAHLIPHLEGSEEVRLWNCFVRGGHVIPTSKLKWIKLETQAGEAKDQMLIVFPSAIHDHSDIRGSIASSAEMTKFRTVSGCLIAPADDVMMLRYGGISAVDRERTYSDGQRNYNIRQYYQYSLETKDGDCGAILMAIHTGIARKVIGLHVAGTIGMGISTPLNIADIERGLREVGAAAQISLNLDPLLAETTVKIALPEGDFVPVGKAIFKTAAPTKTALRESLVHGVITEVTTAPSALRPFTRDGKRTDPMQLGLKKAGKIPPPLDSQKLRACLNDVERVVNAHADPEHCRVLTNFEAVAGVEDDEFLAPINRKSSPGFPLSRDKQGKPGKTRWLGSDEYVLDPQIEEEMEKVVANARNNVRTPTIWTDTLKDERRPLEKVRLGKTRVFAAGPMVYTLVFRKFFLGFAAHCARNRIDNEISVGTNVYSLDWTRTAERLRSKGDKVIAGDFSNFDGTLVLEILAEVVEIINAFYDDGEENAQIRRVLWKEITNSIHACGDDVYMWTHSQPSGCPITAILNSLYNSISMRYVWLTVMPDEFRTMRAFHQHVAMVSYGDDNCVNISDAVVGLFNQITIAEGYAQIGMTYTDETKSGEMVPYRSLDAISYLKRRFMWNEEEHQYVAPLDLGVVLEMINWVRGDFDIEERTVENMETSAFELSLHGREIFEHWIGKYKQATRGFDHRPCFLTYDEYRFVEARKYGRMAAACN